MNEDDRILFELRNETAQTIELDHRRELQRQLDYLQREMSELARQACLEAEDPK